MSNIVFILGAGASKECGAPLMNNFLDVASDLVLLGMADPKKAEFERVFDAIGELQAVHSKAQLDLNYIESIFTVLELGKVIQRIPGIEAADISGVIAALKSLIVTTLELTMEFPVDGGCYGSPKGYAEFARLVRYLAVDADLPRKVSVITFNYDIGADVAFAREGLGPNYIMESPTTGVLRTAIPLMKLHGSLNWAIEDNADRKIRPIHLAEYLALYSPSPGFDATAKARVFIASQMGEYFRTRKKTNVVHPTKAYLAWWRPRILSRKNS